MNEVSRDVTIYSNGDVKFSVEENEAGLRFLVANKLRFIRNSRSTAEVESLNEDETYTLSQLFAYLSKESQIGEAGNSIPHSEISSFDHLVNVVLYLLSRTNLQLIHLNLQN